MKLTFVVLALLSAIPAFADGISPCVPALATIYTAAGFSCTEGQPPDQFTVKNVAWNGKFDNATVTVPASQVLLVPSAPGSFGLSFQGNGVPNPFSVSGTQEINTLFAYSIDPRPPILNGVSLSLTPGGAASVRPGAFATTDPPAFAQIIAFICVGDTFADSCINGIELKPITVDTRTVLDVNVDFPHPVNALGIIMNLDMEANGGSISIKGGGTTASAVPEPGPAADLAFAGLVALLALGYRRLRA